MKKSALAVCLGLVITFGVFAGAISLAAQPAAFNIREGRLGDETVSFFRQYPVIYGMLNKATEDSLNRQIQQATLYSFLVIRNTARQSNSKATGSCVASITFNDEGLLCIELTTNANYSNQEKYSQKDYLTFSTESGKKLYFWNVFSKSSAVHEAVTKIFLQAAMHGEPAMARVKEEISAIGTAPFYLDAKKSLFTVILQNEKGEPVSVSVPIDKLKSMFESSLPSAK